MERKKTMNWDGLRDDDDDDRFFESIERMSCAMPEDLASSSDDEDFEDSRMSFASVVSSAKHDEFRTFATSSPMTPEYDIWMAAPGSIKERRKRLLEGMGLNSGKQFQRLQSKEFQREVSRKLLENAQISQPGTVGSPEVVDQKQDASSQTPLPIVLVRSRSDGDIDTFSISRTRKDDLLGNVSKQRLTRTYSMIMGSSARMCSYPESIRVPNECSQPIGHGSALSTVFSNNRLGAFFLIKNLDTGKEFIVNGYDQDGMWNRLSDIQTGKQLTMEEFEKCVGYSPVVKELMRRENASRINGFFGDRKLNVNSYLSKSLRMSKRRGAALLKNIKGSMTGLIGEKDREIPQALETKLSKNASSSCPSPPHPSSSTTAAPTSSEWVKVRQSGKSYKELSALHFCQEIQAHEGSIWTMKFSCDARLLASAGEDRVIHIWEVQECEVMSMKPNEEGSMTPLHPSICPSPDRPGIGDASALPSEKRKKGKGISGSRKGNVIPDYVHVPESVFSLSEKPICSLNGHLDDVLDLSWSSDSQFNPMDDDYFISGALDAKVRIWNIPDRYVVDWTDLHEMVTAATYTPDGQGAIIGSHKGTCRMYSIEDSKLEQKHQVDIQSKKKNHGKKITGFQFVPGSPTEVLVTSADSRIRILEGAEITHRFRGFRNTSSQITASFSQDGKYVICASEDSQVFVWKREEPRNPSGKKGLMAIRGHEHFPCKDVSVAIPWPGMISGEPPLVQMNSKRHSKRGSSQPASASSSPTRDETNSIANNKKQLPPLPKKNNNAVENNNNNNNTNNNNNNNGGSTSTTPPDEEQQQQAQITRSESRTGESLSSSPSASIRHGDSPSLSSSAAINNNPTSSSWSSSWSWFDVGNSHGHHAIPATAWGLVIVTAGLGGEIRAYQNFGLPRRIGRQTNFWPTT
ncbi:WD repeat-containing protein 44 [Cucumis melo var. makuwa]|uniref:WD repeat-containing protein 44 n=1 Tax=Cucumis melo var. makuwa TaxID=1194695 RepID=A0A5D3DIR1_CUCMM|nr:WD repeat-containing protein 44 [Cucumis melo var. makuwa]